MFPSFWLRARMSNERPRSGMSSTQKRYYLCCGSDKEVVVVLRWAQLLGFVRAHVEVVSHQLEKARHLSLVLTSVQNLFIFLF